VNGEDSALTVLVVTQGNKITYNTSKLFVVLEARIVLRGMQGLLTTVLDTA